MVEAGGAIELILRSAGIALREHIQSSQVRVSVNKRLFFLHFL